MSLANCNLKEPMEMLQFDSSFKIIAETKALLKKLLNYAKPENLHERDDQTKIRGMMNMLPPAMLHIIYKACWYKGI